MSLLTLFDGDVFNPRRLFIGSTAGAIYDYDDYAYLYQKSDGSTPVTALEQPVGLMLDKRWGGMSAIGSELYANQVSVMDNTGGGATVTHTAATRTANVTVAGTVNGYPRLQMSIGMSANKRYVVTGRIDGVRTNINSVRLAISGSANGLTYNSTTGVFSGIQIAGATPVLEVLLDGRLTGSVTVAEFSVRELPGLHAYQATDAARPVISARVNLLLATATLSTQSVTTLAASYTLTFTGTGTVTLSGTATGVKSAGSNVFTATAGTLTLTVSGSVTLADLRLTADANARLPAYQRVTTATDYDSAGFPRFLRIDATDDFLQTASVDPGTDKVFVCAGVTKVSDAAAACVVESSTSSSGVAGSMGLFAPVTAAANYQFRSGGTTPGVGETRAGFASPHTAVVSGIGSISGPSVATRVNGTDGTPVTTTQGTGNFTAQPIYIGARAGTTARLNNGRIYPMVICFKSVTAGEIAATEAWVNARTRAFA